MTEEVKKVTVEKAALMQLVGELRIAVNMSERFFKEMSKYIPYIERWEKELYGNNMEDSSQE